MGAAVTTLDAPTPRGPELDPQSAVEFMREALIKISEDEIATIAREVEAKQRKMAPALAEDALRAGDRLYLRELLLMVFATRRRADEIVEQIGPGPLGAAMADLLHGPEPVEVRFDAFEEALATVHAPVRRDLAGELLRMHDPERYWLWARWMWNPATETGALPLVLVGDQDLRADSAGEIYLKVGKAIDTVLTMADELGFHRMRTSPFAVDVYLGGVYGVYLYTVTRMRMTQEFNQVIPKLPELLRRLFGVHRRED
jgi:hypothetical protein